ncbi:MAG: carboxypeptidase-like regulatory domain-containing protein [Actinomycetes bacterium]
MLEVWTGEAASQFVTSNDDAFASFGSPYGRNAGVSFDVTADQQYVVGLGGVGSATGSAAVRLVEGNGANACAPTNSITGVVRDATGDSLSPQAYAALNASVSDGSGTSVPVQVNASGDLTVPSLPTGTYTIDVIDGDSVFRPLHSGPIPVVAGVVAGPQTITLLTATSITGNLRGPGGAELNADQIAGLHVAAINSAGDRISGQVLANGEFTIGLGPDSGSTFTVFATDYNGAFQDFVSEPFTVADGQTSGGHVVTLAGARSISGTLRGPGGSMLTASQISNLYVSAVNGSGGHVNGSIAPNGDFTIGLNSITGSAFQIRVVDDSDLFAAFRSDPITVADGEDSGGHALSLSLVVSAPPSPAPAPAPAKTVVRSQHLVGPVPAKAKAKKAKRVALATRTDAGTAAIWRSATPKVCTVLGGRLASTGRKGQCRVTASAPAVPGFSALQTSFAIRMS